MNEAEVCQQLRALFNAASEKNITNKDSDAAKDAGLADIFIGSHLRTIYKENGGDWSDSAAKQYMVRLEALFTIG